MTKYAYDVEVDQSFGRTTTMRIVAADENDLADKVEERTKGDAVRMGCKDDYSGTVMYIIESIELPTAQKY
tara:strand:- start:586 stop:798 length:213 start_codon:yes stop_codon:yes gene_type:complete